MKYKRLLVLAVVYILIFLPAIVQGNDAFSVDSLIVQLEQYAASATNQWMLLVMIALATLVSEDLACIAAGLLAAKSIISIPAAILASGIGIYIGDILLYITGYLVGIAALDHPPLKWVVKPQTVLQTRLLFERRGVAMIVTSRFLPGTRTATFFVAGLVKTSLAKLALIFALAVIIWTPILVLSTVVIGREIIRYTEAYSDHVLWIFIGVVIIILIVRRIVVPLFSWRGRRLLISKWRRVSRWEFWPYYVTNSVTFLYVLFLGLVRYRQPTLFTAVNPSMSPDSGFIGERKSDSFKALPQSYLGRWQLIEATIPISQKRLLFDQFMENHSLGYPVVLKPDRGQRGVGVAICLDKKDAYTWLDSIEDDYLMMEFHPGEEFGLFYYRFPGERRGAIFSITKKKHLFVLGDGHHTLEELILRDERALCMAPTFLKRHEKELLNIVPQGESVQLGRVGAHSLGTLFLNGSHLITDELLEAVEKIARPYRGFYFGRFDLKVANEDALQNGLDLKVLEVNGVTSEATHIYDPANSILYGWKTLMHQWSIAFEIAAINSQNGSRPMTFGNFLVHWMKGGRS